MFNPLHVLMAPLRLHCRYIEVKTTVDQVRCSFHISHKQYRLAMVYREKYEIWRVMGAGRTNPTVVPIVDPLRQVEEGKLGMLWSF